MDPRYYETYYRHEDHHWWFRWRYEMIIQLIRELKLGPAPRILDAGCGTGQMLKHLETVGIAYGIDSSPQAVSFAHSRGVQRLVRGSINAIPFPSNTFDCVVALDVIEHVEDDLGILKSLHEVVKSDGRLVVTVPAFQSLWSQHDVINHHKRRYSAAHLRRVIEQSGFAIERITYCNTALCVPVFAARKFKNVAHDLRAEHGHGDEEVKSDLAEYPRFVNEALFRVMHFETRLMHRVNLPFGVSVLAVARPLPEMVSVGRDGPASSREAIQTSAVASH
jgi:SAM-dependent methyltransferase